MEGFVPVSKASLLEMLANCRKQIDIDRATNKAKRIDKYISDEKERCSTRVWYRLWMLPTARFAFNEESVIAYSASRHYKMFPGCPIIMIEMDAENSNRWLNKLERIANSQFADEPIQIDAKMFLRLSEPDNYYWATVRMCYSIPDEWD